MLDAINRDVWMNNKTQVSRCADCVPAGAVAAYDDGVEFDPLWLRGDRDHMIECELLRCEVCGVVVWAAFDLDDDVNRLAWELVTAFLVEHRISAVDLGEMFFRDPEEDCLRLEWAEQVLDQQPEVCDSEGWDDVLDDALGVMVALGAV